MISPFSLSIFRYSTDLFATLEKRQICPNMFWVKFSVNQLTWQQRNLLTGPTAKRRARDLRFVTLKRRNKWTFPLPTRNYHVPSMLYSTKSSATIADDVGKLVSNSTMMIFSPIFTVRRTERKLLFWTLTESNLRYTNNEIKWKIAQEVKHNTKHVWLMRVFTPERLVLFLPFPVLYSSLSLYWIFV